ncbi:hypothetical protein HQN87_06950 [Paenibacillus tritici]|uniref:DNA alkylation repair protein n=1 Tax=Paenibacillus tritici TaxID=1873425 RepID=A0ABX2DLV4_9BACL|nr:hypothetical protein [Paenibacillus tritici]NQX45064.1 hypothetical protein [Paenibacillus tritici]
MAEPLKAMYNKEFLHSFGMKIHTVYGSFEVERFVAAAMKEPWEELELKARMRRITETLGSFLPPAYEEALRILYAIDKDCVGFPYLIFPDFVEVYGGSGEHWELSMEALERFTEKSSAEFAIRPFLLRDPQAVMARMLLWAEHPSEHVRRLASEGSRPRLPWGQALPMFKHDPSPVLPVLEKLKADPSRYVRKSVANHLNDIAKDHPDIVIATARRWKGGNENTDWIVRHGCRSLIRKADPQIMELFGYAPEESGAPLVSAAVLAAQPAVLRIGDSCELQYTLTIREGEPVRIRIEYGIDFVKAAGKTSRKLFLLSDKTVPGGSRLSGTRTHRWADLTTRRHYPGGHQITLLVNGREAASTSLLLEGQAEAVNIQ